MKQIGLVIQLLTISYYTLKQQNFHEKVNVLNKKWNDSYDYIVVGAGTAGCVVASRLSENHNVNVLLIEAGGHQTVVTDFTALKFTNSLANDPNYSWGYKTSSQRYAGQAFVDQKINSPRGRVLGGTSTINWLLHNRGNKKDFDSWVDIYGAKGWSYEEVLPYFMKSENNTDLNIVKGSSGYHSTDGLLTISSSNNANPLILKLKEIQNSNGIPTADFNGRTQVGTGFFQRTQKDGRRQSSATAFIEPFIDRKNLDVITNAFVLKIDFIDFKSNKKANQIRFSKKGINYSVKANIEIIISCGSFDSPKLLMLSGIGPKEHLRELNIPVIADLPVGKNLRDHMGFAYPTQIIDPNFEPNPEPDLTVENLYQFYVNGSGPLVDQPILRTYLSSKINLDKSWPDINSNLFIGFGPKNIDELNNMIEIYSPNKRRQWFMFWKQFMGKQYMNLAMTLQRTVSVGTVKLRSSNPFDDPIIDPNYLSNKQDLIAYTDGFKQAVQYAENMYSKYIKFPEIPIPVCKVCPNRRLSECHSFLECVVRQLSSTDWHVIGTCHMGSGSDPRSVVDERLRVRKVTGLRVIDASVMPDLPNANTNAATIMIGEKGSDMILKDRLIDKFKRNYN